MLFGAQKKSKGKKMMHAHAARPCRTHMLNIHAVWTCRTFMLHVHTAEPSCLSMLHVRFHVACPCSTFTLHVFQMEANMQDKWKQSQDIGSETKNWQQIEWKGANKFSSFLSHKTEVKRIPLLFIKKDEGKQVHPTWPVWPFSSPFFSDQDSLIKEET